MGSDTLVWRPLWDIWGMHGWEFAWTGNFLFSLLFSYSSLHMSFIVHWHQSPSLSMIPIMLQLAELRPVSMTSVSLDGFQLFLLQLLIASAVRVHLPFYSQSSLFLSFLSLLSFRLRLYFQSEGVQDPWAKLLYCSSSYSVLFPQS